jgi:hypothetical protein
MAGIARNRPITSPDPLPMIAANGQDPFFLFSSKSRPNAAYTSLPMFNADARGIRLFVSNDGGADTTSTATLKVQVQDPSTLANWTDLAGAATVALGIVTSSIITIYPGLTGIADSAGITINQHLGPSWRLVLTIGVEAGISSVAGVYLI